MSQAIYKLDEIQSHNKNYSYTTSADGIVDYDMTTTAGDFQTIWRDNSTTAGEYKIWTTDNTTTYYYPPESDSYPKLPNALGVIYVEEGVIKCRTPEGEDIILGEMKDGDEKVSINIIATIAKKLLNNKD